MNTCRSYLLQHGLHDEFLQLDSILQTAQTNSITHSQQTQITSFFSTSSRSLPSSVSFYASSSSAIISTAAAVDVGAGSVLDDEDLLFDEVKPVVDEAEIAASQELKKREGEEDFRYL